MSTLQVIAGVMIAAAVLLALAWQSPRPLSIDVGEPDALYVRQIYGAEAGPAGMFRWTRDESTITFPGAGIGDWHVTLSLAGMRPPNAITPTVEVRTGDGRHTAGRLIVNSPTFQTYDLDATVPSNPLGDVTLAIRTDPTFPALDPPRDLGVALDRAVLRPAGPVLPSPWPLVSLALAAGAFAMALATLGGRRAAAAGGALLALGLAGMVAWDRLLLTPFSVYLLLMGVLLAAATILGRAILDRYAPQHAGALAPGAFALAALLVVLLGFSLVVFGMGLTFLFGRERAVDFQAMWKAAGLLNLGMPLYDVQGLSENPFASFYKYPPLFAGLLRPLGLLDFDSARDVWRGLNIGLLWCAIAVVVTSFTRIPLGSEARPKLQGVSMASLVAPATLAFLFITLIFRPVIDALNYGQLDPPILLLLALTLAALRAGQPALAGIPLALATAFKLYPGVLVLYLAWHRQWRALAGFAAALAIWIVVGLALAGPAAWVSYVTDVLPRSGGSTAWVENQTLSGFAARLFTDRLEPEPFPAELRVRALLLDVVTYAGVVAVLAVTLLAARRPAAPSSAAYALGFGAVVTAGIFVLPSAWQHYLVALLLPIAVAFYALEARGSTWWARRPRLTFWAAALIGFGAIMLAYDNVFLLFDRINYGGLWKLVLSYKLYGAVALWVGLLILIRLVEGDRRVTGV